MSPTDSTFLLVGFELCIDLELEGGIRYNDNVQKDCEWFWSMLQCSVYVVTFALKFL